MELTPSSVHNAIPNHQRQTSPLSWEIRESGAKEAAIDGLHHTAYVVATGLAHSALEPHSF